MPDSFLIDAVCMVHWMWNFRDWNKRSWTLQPVKLEGQDESYSRKWSHMIYYFISLPLLLLFPMAQNAPGLEKYIIQQIYLSERNFSLSWRNTLEHLLLDTTSDSPVCFNILTNIISSDPSPHMVVPFVFVLYIYKHNVKQVGGAGDRQKLINFKHKGNHKIGC